MKINEEKTNNHILKVELQRAFQNPRWILIVLIGVVLFIIGKTRFPQITVTGEYAINTTNRLMLAMSYSELAFIVPLLVLIPYADSLLNDIQSRAIDFLVFRSGRKDYLRSKLFAIALSGGVCLVVVLLVMVLSSSVYGINFKSGVYATGMVNETEPFGPFNWLFMTKPALYLIYLFISAFLFGITYSLFGTAMSLVFKNKFIGFSIPIFVFQIVDYIGVSMNPQPWYLIPLRGLMPFDTARQVGDHDLLLQLFQYLVVFLSSLIIIRLVMKSYGKK